MIASHLENASHFVFFVRCVGTINRQCDNVSLHIFLLKVFRFALTSWLCVTISDSFDSPPISRASIRPSSLCCCRAKSHGKNGLVTVSRACVCECLLRADSFRFNSSFWLVRVSIASYRKMTFFLYIRCKVATTTIIKV